jgi:hypothetical protein
MVFLMIYKLDCLPTNLGCLPAFLVVSNNGITTYFNCCIIFVSGTSVRYRCLKLQRDHGTIEAAETAWGVDYSNSLASSRVPAPILEELPRLKDAQVADICLTAFDQLPEEKQEAILPELLGKQTPEAVGNMISFLFSLISSKDSAVGLLDKLTETLYGSFPVTQHMVNPVRKQVIICCPHLKEDGGLHIRR